jgi:hypothetical protein
MARAAAIFSVENRIVESPPGPRALGRSVILGLATFYLIARTNRFPISANKLNPRSYLYSECLRSPSRQECTASVHHPNARRRREPA